MAFSRIVELWAGPAGSQGINVSGARITYEVTKTLHEEPNSAKIKVFNIQADTASKITTDGNKIILRVGYEDEGVQTLFYGTFVRGNLSRSGVYTILEIEATDGIYDLRNRYVSMSYEAGTPVNKIITDILAVLSIPVSTPVPNFSKWYTHGFVAATSAIEALRKALSYVGYTFSIVDGSLLIFPSSGNAKVVNYEVLLSAKTGLLYHPEPIVDKEMKHQTNAPVKWKLKTLVIPQLIPGGLIKLDSVVKVAVGSGKYLLQGQYKIDSVKFTGDSWEGDSIAELEVVKAD